MCPIEQEFASESICYGCGKRVEKLYRTYWTEGLVGACCVLHSDEFPEFVFADLPTPPQVLDAIEHSPTIEGVQAAFRLIEPMQGELFERKPARVADVYREEVA